MKKLIAIAALVIIAFTSSVFVWGEGCEKVEGDTSPKDSISIIVRNPESCREHRQLWCVIVNNHADSILSFGTNDHTLEIWLKDHWEDVPIWNHIIYDLKEGVSSKSDQVKNYDLGFYKILPPGHYRLGIPMTVSPVRYPDQEKISRLPDHIRRKIESRYERKILVTTEFDME